MTDWYGAHGDDPYTLQYRGCGKEGKYIHFTLDFLLNDDLTAVYGSRGKFDQSRNRQWTALFTVFCA